MQRGRGRPRKFYLIFEYGQTTRICEGLAELYQLTGQHHGLGFRTRLEAEEYAMWRDYRYGPLAPTTYPVTAR